VSELARKLADQRDDKAGKKQLKDEVHSMLTEALREANAVYSQADDAAKVKKWVGLEKEVNKLIQVRDKCETSQFNLEETEKFTTKVVKDYNTLFNSNSYQKLQHELTSIGLYVNRLVCFGSETSALLKFWPTFCVCVLWPLKKCFCCVGKKGRLSVSPAIQRDACFSLEPPIPYQLDLLTPPSHSLPPPPPPPLSLILQNRYALQLPLYIAFARCWPS
jgi:hypothetical protein